MSQAYDIHLKDGTKTVVIGVTYVRALPTTIQLLNSRDQVLFTFDPTQLTLLRKAFTKKAPATGTSGRTRTQFTPELVGRVVQLRRQNLSAKSIGERLGICKNSVLKILKRESTVE